VERYARLDAVLFVLVVQPLGMFDKAIHSRYLHARETPPRNVIQNRCFIVRYSARAGEEALLKKNETYNMKERT
jgi:hypothetical protein